MAIFTYENTCPKLGSKKKKKKKIVLKIVFRQFGSSLMTLSLVYRYSTTTG